MGEAFPELKLSPFQGHAHPTVLRTQIASAVQKISSHISSNSTSNAPAPAISRPTNPELVFVIHGRQLREEFHAFLRAIGLKPLEWSEARRRTRKPNPYTWEVVDQALKEAGCIVALMTPDDEARLATHLWAEHRERARERTSAAAAPERTVRGRSRLWSCTRAHSASPNWPTPADERSGGTPYPATRRFTSVPSGGRRRLA